jgi:hypothetical protein
VWALAGSEGGGDKEEGKRERREGRKTGNEAYVLSGLREGLSVLLNDLARVLTELNAYTSAKKVWKNGQRRKSSRNRKKADEPLSAASLVALFTAAAASLTLSVTVLRAYGVVENARRARRVGAAAERMAESMVVLVVGGW